MILAVGSRFNDRVTGERSRYSANKTIIHLDIDPAELDKNIDSSIGITGNMNMTLNLLEKGSVPHDLSAWWDKIAIPAQLYKNSSRYQPTQVLENTNNERLAPILHMMEERQFVVVLLPFESYAITH